MPRTSKRVKRGSRPSSAVDAVTIPTTGLLTELVAATFLTVKKDTLRQWRVRKQGPKYIKLGDRVAYSMDDLKEWLASRTRGGEAGVSEGR